ncbi:hypothetical protein ACFS5N_00150 [Mucilaginibacter ximonensis]|uniref:Uncharacterized protein n=1 Tax=Mucilaginibacter ximonensis TaxID=538021 RepID=A0ABW5Y668_9SPHI
MTKKKYILKPGKHQFAPGSAAMHENDSLTDKEAAWYIKRYPHIKTLFEQLPGRQSSPIKQTQSEEGK